MDTEGKCGKEVSGDGVAPVRRDDPPGWEEDAWGAAGGSVLAEVDFAAAAWARLPRRVNEKFASPIS
jgi:hypothetical protein